MLRSARRHFNLLTRAYSRPASRRRPGSSRLLESRLARLAA